MSGMPGMKMLKKRGGKKSLRKMRGGASTVTLKWDDKASEDDFKYATVEFVDDDTFDTGADVEFLNDTSDGLYKRGEHAAKIDDEYAVKIAGEEDENEFGDEFSAETVYLKLSDSEFNKLPVENGHSLTFIINYDNEDEDDDENSEPIMLQRDGDGEGSLPPEFALPGAGDGLVNPNLNGGKKAKKRSSKKRSSKKSVSKKRTGGKRKSQKSKKAKKSKKSRKSRKSKK